MELSRAEHRINSRLQDRLELNKPRRLTNRSCINLEHTLLNTRNPSYTGQSQSGILFLHQLLSPTLPSSVGSPLFRRAHQPPVAEIASGSWRLLSTPDPDPELEKINIDRLLNEPIVRQLATCPVPSAQSSSSSNTSANSM